MHTCGSGQERARACGPLGRSTTKPGFNQGSLKQTLRKTIASDKWNEMASAAPVRGRRERAAEIIESRQMMCRAPVSRRRAAPCGAEVAASNVGATTCVDADPCCLFGQLLNVERVSVSGGARSQTGRAAGRRRGTTGWKARGCSRKIAQQLPHRCLRRSIGGSTWIWTFLELTPGRRSPI